MGAGFIAPESAVESCTKDAAVFVQTAAVAPCRPLRGPGGVAAIEWTRTVKTPAP
jgi:hypothetical protein